MLSDDEVQAAVDYGHETASVEFKRAGSLKTPSYAATVARAAMALANSRDGGHILLGVEDQDPAGPGSGIGASDLEEWLQHDDVMAKLNTYADPPLHLHCEGKTLRGGKRIVVIEVREFDSIPILCKRDYSGKLVQGELYTRSMAKPESSRSLTQNELRAVLDLATQKQLRQFVEIARGASIDIGLPGDNDQFTTQYSDLEVLQVTGPRIRFRIHPTTFVQDRLSYEELEQVVSTAYVSGNGWSLPETSRADLRGDDWVGAANEWRLFQSGLFVLEHFLPSDFMADTDGIEDTSEAAGGYVPVWWLTAQVTLAADLATSFQQRVFPELSLQCEIELAGAEGWQLVVANNRRSGFHGSYRLGQDSWRRELIVTPEVALSGGRVAAAQLVLDLLRRFGWRGVTSEIVADLQQETLGDAR